jgi:uncharacterized membrane protein YkvA (DUF1232 family)
MENPISFIYDKLIRGAEKIMNNNKLVSKLIDEAAIKLGSFSSAFYNIQDQIVALVRMLKAWANKEYTDISPKAMVAVVATLIYFVNPFDLVPDFIPIIGSIDDILVISYLIKTLNTEIQRFMAWELEQNN